MGVGVGIGITKYNNKQTKKKKKYNRITSTSKLSCAVVTQRVTATCICYQIRSQSTGHAVGFV